MDIQIGARVRTRDDSDVGEVHRVVIDLERQEVTGVVVLKGRLLSRDILVPLDYVEEASEHRLTLRLTTDQLEALPDFAYNEILTPPPTWAFPLPYPGGSVYIPVTQRQRLGSNQVDLLPGTRVFALNGDIGTVDRVETEAHTGRVDAFWIRSGALLQHDVRVPAEWVERVEEDGVRVAASREEIQAQLGAGSRAREGGPPR